MIPKVKTPEGMADFRPISSCNIIYEDISKLIVNRMKPLLPVLVDSTQSAFIENILITDNVILLQKDFIGYAMVWMVVSNTC